MPNQELEVLQQEQDQEFVPYGDVLSVVTRRDEGKSDKEVFLGDCGFDWEQTDGSAYMTAQNQRLTFRPSSLSKLMRVFKMSPSYFGKLPRSYIKDHFDYHFRENSSMKLTLKLRDASQIRGVLTDEENNISNLDLYSLFHRDFNRNNEFIIQDFKGTEDKLYLRFILNQPFNLGNPNDPFYVGFYLNNNELSPISFDMGLMVFRLVCSNGAIQTFANHSLFPSGFKTFSVNELLTKLPLVIDGVRGELGKAADRLNAMKEIAWTNETWDEFKLRLRKARVTNKFKQLVNDNFESPPQNLYLFYDTMTRVSQEYSVRTRFTLDTISGKILFEGIDSLV